MRLRQAKTIFGGLTFLASIILSACASHPETARPGATIADLPSAALPDIARSVSKLPTEQVVENYLDALEIIEDQKVRHQINTRLADLQMSISEDALIEGVEVVGSGNSGAGLFTTPISLYERLLENSEKSQDTERLLYQLSKAYALDAKSELSEDTLTRLIEEYPDSKFAAEAEFRLAERAFSENNYGTAKHHYSAVVTQGEQTDFYESALYMLGWSDFKLNQYQPALGSFMLVLDRLIGRQENLNELTNTQQNLAEDTLRVSSIAFSYLGGAISIQETLSVLGPRPYSALLYQNLGSLYESQERFKDAADTYLAFVKEQPFADKAPDFSEAALQTYYNGNFPSLIAPAKEEFIANYGVRSQYWALKGDAVKTKLKPYLSEYLQELASHNHALAQDENIVLSHQERIEAYLQAAQYYDEFILTFPSDIQVSKFAYLMGEAFFAANAFIEAAEAYEKVAYVYKSDEYGADAGYNVILSIDSQISNLPDLPGQSSTIWHDKKLEASIRFADTYSFDDRAASVLAQASDQLFQNNELESAIETSQRLTNWQPQPDHQTLRTAWLIIGHSQFELAQFIEAEAAYKQLLAILPSDDELIPDIEERMAASLYRQGEQLADQGQLRESIDMLLSIRDRSPTSEVAIIAHFDAINYLMELEEWEQSSAELQRFSSTYQAHPLSEQIPAKQVLVYQELEEWELAANAVLAMVDREEDPEIKRQSLYFSAELYERAGADHRTKNVLERYVASYPSPVEFTMEAYYQLAELNSSDIRARNRWLNRILDNANNADNRSRYLGAWAATDLANQEYDRFAALRLTLPLPDSLKAKQTSLQTTLNAYNRVLDFGVAEFTTQASYQIGEVYAELSRAIFDSQRPSELDALALEQYDILLEEQAYPFEDKAIELHEANIQRSWNGDYDKWVKSSFAALAKLLPARYNKVESRTEVSRGIH